MKTNPDIAQIVWFDARRAVIDALPAPTPGASEVDAFGPPVALEAFELASRMNKHVYSEPYFLSGNIARFEIAVPIYAEHAGGRHAGGRLPVREPARQPGAVVVHREIPGRRR